MEGNLTDDNGWFVALINWPEKSNHRVLLHF
jgi:hypothetical protein